MKIIIVGAGKVGSALTQQLSADGHNVTVVDQDPQLIDNIINIYDVMGVCGNGAVYGVQKEAEVEKAELLIATTSSDELNILSCLVARKLGAKHTIARIRNPEYEKQLRFMRDELGLSMAINPERAAAREIARVLRFPTAMKVETFSKGRLELVEYRLPADSALDGLALADLYRNIRVRVLICAVARKGGTIIPSGDFVLRAGDKIYLTSSPDQLAQFFRHLGVFRSKASTVMIVGASKICYYLTSELLNMGMSVKIIDRDEQRCIQMGEQLPKALVIVGDGTDTDLLHEEGIGQTLPLRDCFPTHKTHTQHSFPPPPSLGYQVSTGLGTSSPTETRQGSPLLHVCWRPRTSPSMLFGWWLSRWELPGSRLINTVVLPMGLPSPAAISILSLTLPFLSLYFF